MLFMQVIPITAVSVDADTMLVWYPFEALELPALAAPLWAPVAPSG